MYSLNTFKCGTGFNVTSRYLASLCSEHRHTYAGVSVKISTAAQISSLSPQFGRRPFQASVGLVDRPPKSRCSCEFDRGFLFIRFCERTLPHESSFERRAFRRRAVRNDCCRSISRNLPNLSLQSAVVTLHFFVHSEIRPTVSSNT